jgi:amino-acid N-acetyltransferase
MSEPETTAVQIRGANAADIAGLEQFIAPFVEANRLLPRTAEELGELLTHGFVAVQDGRIIGFASLEVYSPKLAEIRSLAVDRSLQRSGIGRQLVAACVARAREQDVLEVMAITSSDDFFKSCGFDFTLPGEKKALFITSRNDES